ncbi:glutaredoxin family protein [Nocardiopsis kunsanensis]|uniref:Glutaredoxin n=1 Tax=Nocardiopsis kunsanensis TaxID=141693 RepID=A0A919CIX7_9ACTN|nr:glutaredoxin family protein [Nocardiopsis kunsanensis]GHD29466.1 glutaredoxin [Nocardiopsis kunsanensis]
MDDTGNWADSARVVVLGKPDCHLCAHAWEVVERVTDELGATRAEVSLHDVSESEREDYWDKIPVTFVDGERHDFWRVDEGRLRSVLNS